MSIRYVLVSEKKILKMKSLQNLKRAKKDLSIVIPCYNEQENIIKLVSELTNILSVTKFAKDYEIIVVDDCSKDKTPEIINNLAKTGKILAMHRRLDKGIFTAVLDGIKVANGDYIITMDADLSHSPATIPSLFNEIEKFNFVIASRYVKGGKMQAPLTRRFGGFILNRICSKILGLGVKDLGGNFRLFRKKDFEKIKFKYDCVFAEFGQELYYRAKKLEFSVKEVPFIYKDRKKGFSKMGNLPLKQAIYYIKRSFEIRRND